MTNWSHLHGLLLGVTCTALIGCQAVQPAPSSPATLDSSASSAPSASSAREETLDVRLEAVGESRPEASLQTRNPFRFGSPSPGGLTELEPGPQSVPTPVPLAAPAGGLPAVQPRVRMIGLVEAPETVGLIAVLTDGTAVFHGRAGDIVEGQYRVVSVEPTSVELESLSDGRRQLIRLSSR